MPGKGKKVILGDLEDQFMTKKTTTEIPESLNPASQCILISSMSGRSVPLPAWIEFSHKKTVQFT